jgi:hypothetical protein
MNPILFSLTSGLSLALLMAVPVANAQSGTGTDWSWATQLGPTVSPPPLTLTPAVGVGGITTDAAGNVTIGGYFDPDLSFANEATVLRTNRQPDPATTFTFSNGFLAQYRLDGRLAWAMNLESRGAGVVDLASDAAGNVYALGYRSAALTFGDGGPMLPATNRAKYFVVKLSPLGVAEWAIDVLI